MFVGDERHWDELRGNKDEILNVRREAARRGGAIAKILDHLGRYLAHPAFFLAVLAFHAAWLLWNSGWLGLPRFDPPPFALLAMIASVEAPFLSLLILMNQRSQQRLSQVSEETDIQIALHTERETTRLLELVGEIHAAMKLNPSLRDQTYEHMTHVLKPEQLVAHLQDEINTDDAE